MRLFSTIFILLALPFTLISRDIYILFDSNCMDRLEYGYSNNDGSGSYIVYHINMSFNEKIVLEVGQESNNVQNYIPSNFRRCDNGDFDLQLVQSVNNRIDRIFIVNRIGRKQYVVTPVRFAGHYKIANDLIQYFSTKYRFEFDLNMGVIGENIAFQNNRSEVYFEGRLDNECSGAFIFRQYSEARNSPAHTDLVLVPEIGIVEERSGRDVEDAFNNTLSLEKINDIDVRKYLNKLCNNIDIEPDNNEAGNENSDLANYEGNDKDQLSTKGNNNNNLPNNNSGSDQIHTVKKGETLYRIAKNYGVSVDQVKAWNNKNANTILIGEQLLVSQPTFNNPSSANTNTVEEEDLYVRGGDNNPAPYDNVSNYNTRMRNPGRNNIYAPASENEHVVRPGETVASIAMKYGFTESKFREINDLSTSQFVRIGQKLKTSDCDCKDGALGNNFVPQGYESNEPPLNLDNSNQFYEKGGKKATTPINKNVPSFYDTPSRNFQEKNGYMEDGDIVVPKGYYQNTPTGYGYNSNSVQRKKHKVLNNETIYSIANKYNLSIEKLRELNGMERGEVVLPGQSLYIE